jgi:hypothetical protein
MKEWFLSLSGALTLSALTLSALTLSALTLSALTLLSQLWRGFLDAMFVLPVAFGDESMMQLAAVIFTALFAGWSWAIWSAWRGSRRGLLTAFVINGLVLLVVPISWLLFYCPSTCRAEAGIFNLANTLNLVLGLLAGIALAVQLWLKPQPIVEAQR